MINNSGLLAAVKKRPHRQADHFSCDSPSDGRAFRAAQGFISRLLVKRQGIVDGGGDARLMQALLQGVAVWNEDAVLGEYTGATGPLPHTRHTSAIQQPIVGRANLQAPFNFPVKAFEFGQHDRALDRVHAPAHADAAVLVSFALPVHADFTAGPGKRIVTGENRAAVAIAPQGLAGKETGTTDRAQVAAFPALVFRAKTLRGVFNNRQTMLFRNGIENIHVGRLAVEADGHNGPGLVSDGRLDQVGIDVTGVRFDIDKDRPRAEAHDDFGRGNEGKGRGDDFIAGFNPQRHQTDQQGLRAARDSDAVPGAGIGRKPLFQFLNLRPHDILAMLQNTVNARLNPRLQGPVLRFEINKGDTHATTSVSWLACSM